VRKVSICGPSLASGETLPAPFADPPEGGERRAGRRDATLRRRTSPLRRLIRAIDWGLRRIEGIREYCDRSECLLRISLGRAGANMQFTDGSALCGSAQVLDLHLWNEHLPNLETLTLARTNALRRQLRSSLCELADHIESETSLANVAALRARTAFVPYAQTEKLRHVARSYGFDMVEYAGRGSIWWRAHDFLENFLICALAWAYNPNALRGKGLLRPRCQFWISRGAFLKRYGKCRGEPRHKAAEQQGGALRGDRGDRVAIQRIGEDYAVRWYGFADAVLRHRTVPALEQTRCPNVAAGGTQPRKP
jgi:hypothetical protein